MTGMSAASLAWILRRFAVPSCGRLVCIWGVGPRARRATTAPHAGARRSQESKWCGRLSRGAWGVADKAGSRQGAHALIICSPTRAPASHAPILTAPPRVPSWCPLTPSPRTSCEKLSARDGFRPKTGDPGRRTSQTAPLRLRVPGARRAHPSPASHLAARRRRGPRRVPGAWRRRWRPPGPSARTRRPPGRRRTCLNGLQPLIRAPHPSIVAAEPRRFPRRHSQIQPCTSSSARSCWRSPSAPRREEGRRKKRRKKSITLATTILEDMSWNSTDNRKVALLGWK